MPDLILRSLHLGMFAQAKIVSIWFLKHAIRFMIVAIYAVDLHLKNSVFPAFTLIVWRKIRT